MSFLSVYFITMCLLHHNVLTTWKIFNHKLHWKFTSILFVNIYMCNKSFYHKLTPWRTHLRVKSMPHLHSTWTSSKQKSISTRDIPYTYTSHSSYLDDDSKLHQRKNNKIQHYSLIIALHHFHNLGKVKFELDTQKGFVFLSVESLKT
jgi:hypothetical protein